MIATRRMGLWVATCLVLQGCVAPTTSVYQYDRVIRGQLPEGQLGQDNLAVLKANLNSASNPKLVYFESGPDKDKLDQGHVEPPKLAMSQEWAWNRDGKKGAPPRHCLALSGGGMRSASFSIGVLSALAANGDLDNVDIISSVSGGTYASSWYFTQKVIASQQNRTFDLARLFLGDGRPGRELEHLKSKSRLMTWTDIGGAITGNVLYLPFNFAFNGFFGWHANTSYAHRYYRRNVRRTFLTAFDQPDPVDPTVFELGKEAQRLQLPLFVFNATALLDDSRWHHAASLTNSIFEFTPLWFGSDALARWHHADDRPNATYTDVPNVPISLAVAISGAAYDTEATVSGPSQTVLSTATNMDLGYYFPNPGIPQFERDRTKIYPFPFYYQHRYLRDAQGTYFYISDGGHSENLGLFSLVRRGCENIIVVDGEHDPRYQFESYIKVRRALLQEIGVKLSVREIDERDHVQPVDRDLVHWPVWKHFSASPVFTGTIASLPLQGRGDTIKVTYVKLAYTAPDCPDCPPLYPGTPVGSVTHECDFDHPRIQGMPLIDVYYHCVLDQRHKKLAWLRPFPFPQQSTLDQNFSPEQLEAYVRLGARIIERHCPGIHAGGRNSRSCFWQ